MEISTKAELLQFLQEQANTIARLEETIAGLTVKDEPKPEVDDEPKEEEIPEETKDELDDYFSDL